MAAMMRPTYSAILNHAQDGEPAIVFVPSRWHALRAALELLTFAAADGQPKRFLQVCLAPSDQPGATLPCLCCKHILRTALQLGAIAAAVGQPKRFLQVCLAALGPFQVRLVPCAFECLLWWLLWASA